MKYNRLYRQKEVIEMTKKHFKAIAGIIKKTRADLVIANTNTEELADNIAIEFADYLESQNPLFNRGKFLCACGMSYDVSNI